MQGTSVKIDTPKEITNERTKEATEAKEITGIRLNDTPASRFVETEGKITGIIKRHNALKRAPAVRPGSTGVPVAAVTAPGPPGVRAARNEGPVEIEDIKHRTFPQIKKGDGHRPSPFCLTKPLKKEPESQKNLVGMIKLQPCIHGDTKFRKNGTLLIEGLKDIETDISNNIYIGFPIISYF